jgi:DNA-directed RNA polymerase specialized sigma24 family protein
VKGLARAGETVGGDDDFGDYVAARWVSLVRSAVLLGCSAPEAEDLVQTTLERCLLKWEKVRVAEDRNAYVHRVLINQFISARRRRWTGERPAAVLPDQPGIDQTVGVDDSDQDCGLAELHAGRTAQGLALPRHDAGTRLDRDNYARRQALTLGK